VTLYLPKSLKFYRLFKKIQMQGGRNPEEKDEPWNLRCRRGMRALPQMYFFQQVTLGKVLDGIPGLCYIP